MSENEILIEVKYFKPDEIRFEKTTGGFLSCSVKDGANLPRVNLYRAFPLTKPDEFISVRDMDDKEIGIIRRLSELDEELVRLIRDDLGRRYFSPEVKQILTLKEEYGYVYMDIKTDSGVRQVTIPSGSSNFIRLSDVHIILVDIDGNRYDINDYSKLDARSVKLIENVI